VSTGDAPLIGPEKVRAVLRHAQCAPKLADELLRYLVVLTSNKSGFCLKPSVTIFQLIHIRKICKRIACTAAREAEERHPAID